MSTEERFRPVPDEVPPWHPYCGCAGCRRGRTIGERAVKAVVKHEFFVDHIGSDDVWDCYCACGWDGGCHLTEDGASRCWELHRIWSQMDEVAS
jgi:hypothetical protein